MRNKKIPAALLIGICALLPSTMYGHIEHGGGITRPPAVYSQAEALGMALREFTASPDANPKILENRLPALNMLSGLDLSDTNHRVIGGLVPDAIKDSIAQLDHSFAEDFSNYRDPSDALVKAKKWETLNKLIHSPLFSEWFTDENRAYVKRGADFYQFWLSKEKEDKRQELAQAMHGIELALNGDLPARLAESEIPAVDARGSRTKNPNDSARVVSDQLIEGLRYLEPATTILNSGSMIQANPIEELHSDGRGEELEEPQADRVGHEQGLAQQSEAFYKAQALIERLGHTYEGNAKNTIAYQLTSLVRLNPTDEVLQRLVAQGIVRDYHADESYGRLLILRELWHATYLEKVRTDIIGTPLAKEEWASDPWERFKVRAGAIMLRAVIGFLLFTVVYIFLLGLR